jgi:hypothetical protein
MNALKHVGKMKNTGAKVLVVFRTLPGESNMALVLPTSTLPDQYHDALIQLVDSEQAQNTNEFGEIMFIRRFPDGSPMLQLMQQAGRLQKVATDTVLMTPTLNSSIPLDQLNIIIAEQRNVAVDDLASLVTGGTSSVTEKPKQKEVIAPEPLAPLSEKDLAKKFRSDADALYKEAAQLRKQADELDPPQKKTKKAEDTASVETSI